MCVWLEGEVTKIARWQEDPPWVGMPGMDHVLYPAFGGLMFLPKAESLQTVKLLAVRREV